MDFTVLKENLIKRGYAVREFDTAREAADYLDRAIDGKTVGMGGSVTLENMGMYERLTAHNKAVWHWRSPENKAVALREAMTAEVYLSSVNGIAETGEIVNIDGTCNRVSAMLYGHQTVYFVVGENKIAPTESEAVFRARNIAAPLNAKRLARKTPCAVRGDRCYNCDSPERICNAAVTFWKAPGNGLYEVILVHEALGF